MISHQTIEADTSDDGDYTWTIPDSLEARNDYRMIISFVDQPEIYSDVMFVLTDTANPTITLTAPTSRETWQTGVAETVNWTSTDSPGNVRLELFWGSSAHRLIVASTPDDGAYTWTVPTSLGTRSDYRLVINFVDQTEISNEVQFQISNQP